MAGRHLLRAGALASTALLGTLTAGCLEDLATPTSCPPPARVPSEGCEDVIAPTTASCFPESEMQCLTGERQSCGCQPDECPSSEASCYPPGDCPAAVQQRHAAASCLTLEPEDLRPLLPRSSRCVCGCEECLARCDGFGPVFGVRTDGTLDLGDFLVPMAQVGAELPEAGRLGVYLRMRGLGSVLVMPLRGDPEIPSSLTALHHPNGDQVVYLVVNQGGKEFVEYVLFDQSFVDLDAYSWTEQAAKPELIALSVDDTPPRSALFEIDCLVPFFLPK